MPEGLLLWGLLVAIGFGAGVAFALWLVHTEPAPLPPLPPKPPPAAPGVVARFTGPSRALARQLLPNGTTDQLEGAAEVLGAFGADAWSRGITDLRGELCRGSGLPASMVDQACSVALDGLEGRR